MKNLIDKLVVLYERAARVDENGDVAVAQWGGGKAGAHVPSRRLIKTDLPKHVTCVLFTTLTDLPDVVVEGRAFKQIELTRCGLIGTTVGET